MTNRGERTSYDRVMLEKYDNTVGYHTAPFPTPRTVMDNLYNKAWCPSCKNTMLFKNQTIEGFADYHCVNPPWLEPRTEFDAIMNQTWCPKCSQKMCSGNKESFNQNTAYSLYDPHNKWSASAKWTGMNCKNGC